MINLVHALPNTAEGRVIGTQLLRCSTAVGANYRAACIARLPADFTSKLGLVLEEADEAAYWLELLSDCRIIKPERLNPLLAEARELAAVFAASRITASRKHDKGGGHPS